MVWGHEPEGKRIRRLREERGMTQDQLADLSGLSWDAIDRIGTGESFPVGQYSKRIADALQVSAEYLQQGDTPSERETESLINRMVEQGECTSGEADGLKQMAMAKLRSSNNAKIPPSYRQIEAQLKLLRSLRDN